MGFAGVRIARLWLPGLPEKKLYAKMAQWTPETPETKTTDLARRIRDYFDGGAPEFPDEVAIPQCGGFIREVYARLREIRRGDLITYKEMAALAGSPGAARAVGSAMARNPVPLVIPCHRVVRSDGSPGEFTAPGGAALKLKMLEMERLNP